MINMKSLLIQAGYSYDQDASIWTRQDYQGINYNDGDEVEKRIASILNNATDLSVLSDELRPHCIDWPSLYHLSANRANILRPFEQDLRGDILEVGAGCGAISRYLGECGGNVLALEGTPRRAAIASARTRDLANVTVVSDNFEEFKYEKKFDVVTLIGVLEYANLFTAGNNPALSMLERVRSFLKPNGKLFIAIENQFGLKYFAGAPEDHVGVPMYGVEARYRKKQPQTYGRNELSRLINGAGFANIEFLAPFPDYKLPVSIVTERGFSNDDFDAAAFACQNVRRDPQLPKIINFSPELVWPSIISNGLSIDLSNSFLVVAAPQGNEKLVCSKTLAWHFTTSRRKSLCKATQFVRSKDDCIEVLYARFDKNVTNPVIGNHLQHCLPEKEEYVLGRVLLNDFVIKVSRDDWSASDISEFLSSWLNFLSKLVLQNDDIVDFANPFSQIAGSLFDCIPQNIIQDGDDSFHVIDNEWALNEEIEIGFLVYRGLLALINSVTKFGRPADKEINTFYDFLVFSMKSLGWTVSYDDISRWVELEWEIQSEVAGRSVDSSGAMDWLVKNAFPITNLSQAVSEREVEIGKLKQGLSDREVEIGKLKQGLSDREVEIGNLKADLSGVINSRSWRMTKLYRWVGRVSRGDFAAAMVPFQKMLGVRMDGQEPIAVAPADGDIVVPSPVAPTHGVSVILPVYRGIDMTRRCIEAAMPGVLAMEDAKLLAINDGSPDQGMQAMLESLEVIWPGRFEVLENPVNLGFVETVNRGMAHFPSQDVVLLNTDVIVPVDWLKRLQVDAYSHPRVATVTPFSNNATICSFPHFLEQNPQAFNLDVHSIDAVFRQSTLPCIVAPTGIGFCMFIRRACLDQIGCLNAEKFGRGYGEENDLCQRAIKAGWLNILSPNIYAFHEGSVSFSTDKQALVDRAMRVIDELHPNYHADVQRFIQRDPARSMRVKRYLNLFATLSIPKVLHISHGLGGGVDQHIKELTEYFGQRAAHLVLSPQEGPGLVSLSLGSCQSADKLMFAMPNDYNRLRHLLYQMGISAVHYHHTLNLDPVLLNLAQDLHVSQLLTVHDFFLLNANPTLTGADGRFPGKYLENLHNPSYPLPPSMTASKWREQFRPLIEQADCVIFPSNATRILFGDMYRLDHAVVAQHVEPHRNVRQALRQSVQKRHYVIGVLGAISREKGADVLENLAEMAQSQDARFSFTLIGYAYRQLNALKTTGPYNSENLTALIEKLSVDVILFPAQCPETYSYTLSTALAMGLPIIAPNLGAFPERLSGRTNTMLFDHLKPVDELYRYIVEFISGLETGNTVTAPVFHDDWSQSEFYDRDYLCIVGRKLKQALSDKPLIGLDDLKISNVTIERTGWRYVLLRILWQLHTQPLLRRVNDAVPYRLKRSIKRSLSRSPMHDLVDKS